MDEQNLSDEEQEFLESVGLYAQHSEKDANIIMGFVTNLQKEIQELKEQREKELGDLLEKWHNSDNEIIQYYASDKNIVLLTQDHDKIVKELKGDIVIREMKICNLIEELAKKTNELQDYQKKVKETLNNHKDALRALVEYSGNGQTKKENQYMLNCVTTILEELNLNEPKEENNGSRLA